MGMLEKIWRIYFREKLSLRQIQAYRAVEQHHLKCVRTPKANQPAYQRCTNQQILQAAGAGAEGLAVPGNVQS